MKSVDFVLYASAVIAGLLVYYFIVRFALDIPKRNRYHRAQLELLAKIAEKQGVSKDDIEVIVRVADMP
jgi:chromosome segregation and condensation protein ScpB